jgi:hypothetical protein
MTPKNKTDRVLRTIKLQPSNEYAKVSVLFFQDLTLTAHVLLDSGTLTGWHECMKLARDWQNQGKLPQTQQSL